MFFFLSSLGLQLLSSPPIYTRPDAHQGDELRRLTRGLSVQLRTTLQLWSLNMPDLSAVKGGRGIAKSRLLLANTAHGR